MMSPEASKNAVSRYSTAHSRYSSCSMSTDEIRGVVEFVQPFRMQVAFSARLGQTSSKDVDRFQLVQLCSFHVSRPYFTYLFLNETSIHPDRT